MKLPTLMPTMIRRRPGRVEFSLARATRALYAGLGVLLVVILAKEPEGRPFAIMFAIVIALAVLAEDRWIFDREAGEVRRRYGLFLASKSWALDLDSVASLELAADFTGAEGGDPYGKVRIGQPKGRSALSLTLADGRTLVICAARRERLSELRELGLAAAEALDRPLVES